MFAKVLVIATLSTSVFASEFYSSVNTFGAMLKRQGGGYHPTTHICGQGDTCAEACGPTTVQCPSKSGLYCYDPTVGEHCCPDLTGNACDKGYYCTSDGAGNTYCCPDGATTSDCAAAYSLSLSLIKETSSVAPTASTPGYASTTPVHVSLSTSGPTTQTIMPTQNATYTTASPSQFTGGAAKFAGAGMAVLAAAGGIAGML